MVYSAIENLLKEKIGLDPSSIGSSSVTRIIRRCFTESGHDDLDGYIRALQTSGQEMKTLIEAIVVPETWFFRDKKPFLFFRDHVKKHWLPGDKTSQGILRILSVPCSTGEEPYSLAMALSDIGYPSSRYQIDAVDISTDAIARARRGTYSENSFRGDEMDFRDQYFVKENKDYKLSEKIREMVNFYHGNLLDTGSFPVYGPYHIIFCRNLLIYFDRADQGRTISALHNLLALDGVFFMGHAETSQILNGWFSPLKYRGAFAFRKLSSNHLLPGKTGEIKIESRGRKAITPGKSPATAVGNIISRHRPFSAPEHKQIPMTSAVVIKNLDHVRMLADEGRLSEASALCKQYVADHPDSSEAYYLLGVLNDASGDAGEAEEMFRKAVYLDPHHHEALLHLSLHAERSGNKTASRNLKRRAKRAVEKSKS